MNDPDCALDADNLPYGESAAEAKATGAAIGKELSRR